MAKSKLKPCPFCGGTNIKVETWSSGGRMFMVKCNNPDCAVPPNGYPTGRNLEMVKEEWNKRADNAGIREDINREWAAGTANKTMG